MAQFRRNSRSRIGVLVFLLLVLVLVPAGADAQIDPTLERWYLMSRPTGNSSYEYQGNYTIRPGSRANVAVSPIDGQYRYVALSTNGMLVSHDAGVSWTNVASRTAANVDVMQVVASSVDAHTVFANFDRTLFFSGDGGFNWGYVTQPVEFFNVSRDARRVYSVSDAGITTVENGQTRYQFAPAWELNYDSPVNGVVAVDAADSDTAYAVVNRLLLVTNNGGASWETPSLFANVLFDHVLANDTVSGLAYALSDSTGLYRTTNGGVSWGLVADLSPYADSERSYPKLLYARDDRLLFSGTAAAQRNLPCDDVIYVSEDRGATWNTDGTAVRLEGAQACTGIVYNVVSSSSGQLIGLVSHIPSVNSYSYRSGKTLITSSDGGDHWQVVEPASDSTSWFSVSADGSVIYLNGGAWMARSDDGGETWKHLEVNLKTITLDPNDPDTIYGVNKGVFRSRDGGETWTRLPVPSIYSPASYPFVAVYTPPSRSGVVYLMQPNLYSTDYGETWTPLGGDTDRDYYVAAANPADPLQVFFGATSGLGGSGLYWSGDGGERVGLRGMGPEWSIDAIAFDPSQPSTMYTIASTNGQTSLYVSSDEGVTWLPVADVTSIGLGGPGLYLDERFPGTLVVDPHDSNTLYLSRQGVYLSHDGGRTWEEFMRGMSRAETVTSLAITDRTLWAVGVSGLWRMSLN